jgi:hypothetical protein
MANDGKPLQDLTEFIERTLHPAGFEIITNWCEFDADGNFLAEFDIQFIGTQEKSGFKWLIECRDRPSQGPAPGSWIEQLVARRSRFNFNKVTAVSSTGFARGAANYAAAENIELKEVRSLKPEHFASWMRIEHIEVMEPNWKITNVAFSVDKGIDPAHADALNQILRDHATNGRQNEPLLKGVATGTFRSLNEMFSEATHKMGDWKDLVPHDPPKSVIVHLDLKSPGSVFVIETAVAAVPIEKISIAGDIWIVKTLAPISKSLEYRRRDQEGFIAQSVQFEPQDDGKARIVFELHHIPESGYTHLVVREQASSKKDP